MTPILRPVPLSHAPKRYILGISANFPGWAPRSFRSSELQVIQTVDNASGHYQPGAHLLDQFKGWLASRNVNLDNARFSTWDRTDHAQLVATTSEPIEINYEPGETAVEGLQSSGESPMEGGQTGFYEDEPEPSPEVSNLPFLYI